MPRSIEITSPDHWHQLRAGTVGASEVAQLFEVFRAASGTLLYLTPWDDRPEGLERLGPLSPFGTPYQLFQFKAGRWSRDPKAFDNSRVRWGTRLEEAIARGIAEDQGWRIRNVRRYLMSDTVEGMGASLDFEIIGQPAGPAPLEIKTVDRAIWHQRWVRPVGGAESEAPLYIELQLQHQIAITGRAWGAIGVLVGGNEDHVLIRDRDAGAIAAIERAVGQFWAAQRGELPPPEPTDADDWPAVQAVAGAAIKGQVADLTQAPRIDDMVSGLALAREMATHWGKAADAYRAQILHHVGSASAAVLPDGGQIEAPSRQRAGYWVEPTSYRDVKYVPAGKVAARERKADPAPEIERVKVPLAEADMPF